MIRFRVIASMQRGAIEPGELLEFENHEAALARLEHDGIWELNESVVWRGNQPVVVVGKMPGCDRRPKVAQDTARILRGIPVEMCEKSARQRERRGYVKRMG
jgi:hypothetical protein